MGEAGGTKLRRGTAARNRKVCRKTTVATVSCSPKQVVMLRGVVTRLLRRLERRRGSRGAPVQSARAGFAP